MAVEKPEVAEAAQEELAAATASLGATTAALEDAILDEPEPDVTQML